ENQRLEKMLAEASTGSSEERIKKLTEVLRGVLQEHDMLAQHMDAMHRGMHQSMMHEQGEHRDMDDDHPGKKKGQDEDKDTKGNEGQTAQVAGGGGVRSTSEGPGVPGGMVRPRPAGRARGAFTIRCRMPAVRDILSAQGPIAGALGEAFEPRAEQLEMADAVF